MDEITVTTYNKLAREYDEETAGFWELFPKSFVDTFALHAKGKILDVGSGPGRDALLLIEKGFDVTCVDASSEMVQLSTERGLTSVVGDFMNLPFDDESFDGVWAYTSLLHVSRNDIGKALKEIYRVMKPQGIFALGLIEGETEEYKESSGVNLPRLFTFYKKEEIEALLKEHGFEIIYFEKIKPRSKEYLNFITRKV
jgi:ubiquinone/menaquinone biosynthesis C-methylase UbiE